MATELKDKLEVARAAQQAGTSLTTAKSTVFGWLQDSSTHEQIKKALPAGMKAERFWRIVQTELRRNPALAETTPASFALAVITAAQLGLEPGPLGLAYLVPLKIKNVPTTNLWLGYKGLIELARRSERIASIRARGVHEGDFFRYAEGLDDRLEHVPDLDGAEDRKLLGAYCVAKFTNGGHAALYMTVGQIEKIRSRSRAKDDGPWVTDYERMCRKTVVRQMANAGELPLTIEAAVAIAEDEERELGLTKDLQLQDLPAFQAPEPEPEPTAAAAGESEESGAK